MLEDSIARATINYGASVSEMTTGRRENKSGITTSPPDAFLGDGCCLSSIEDDDDDESGINDLLSAPLNNVFCFYK